MPGCDRLISAPRGGVRVWYVTQKVPARRPAQFTAARL